MRFCPFCAQETSDDAGRCVHCGRRLGPRTMQTPQVAGPRPTMLGVGGAASSDSDSLGGPTTVGGPAGLLSDFAEPPSTQSPSAAETQVNAETRFLTKRTVSDERSAVSDGVTRSAAPFLEEDTHLPPPAPGMVPPGGGFDPPTMPGPEAVGGPPSPGRLRGLAPLRRHPDGDHDSTPQLRRDPASRDSAREAGVDPGELTSPMAIVYGSAFQEEPTRTPKLSASGNGIPALPPPPSGVGAMDIRGGLSAELQAQQPTPLRPGTGAAATGPKATGGVPTGPVPTGALLTRSAPIPLRPMAPIPVSPSSPGALSAVLYLVPVARGLAERRREQARIRKLLQVEQQSLDGILSQLGRAAHEERLDLPPLTDETTLLRQAEDRRDRAQRQIAQLSVRKTTEEQRASAHSAESRRAIDRLSGEANHLEAELRQRADHRRRHQAELARLDGILRTLSRTAELADQRAAERAHDPQAASQARAQGDSARGQAEALYPQRDAAQREVAQTEGPIAELTEKLGAVRSELGLVRQDLQRHEQDQAKLMQALDEDLKLQHAEREAAEREMQQRMMTVGTLVNLNRAGGTRFAPLYQQVDDVKGRLSGYESALARLDTESESIDRHAVQRGLIVLGAGGLALGLLVAVLYIVWGISHGGRG